MINCCALGGLVRDEPEIGYSGQDEPICSFMLSVMSFKIRVECYGRIALVAAKYVHQGTRVVVTGFFGLGYKRTLEMTLIATGLDLLKCDRDLKQAPFLNNL